ncbi:MULTISPECIES: DUF6578 domain-containing protein [unclassified Cryobacterium]|uniref:DUF6578 domain-containing protein n=1 Tax=unclassified Cryobacterium TaxID=2649013 RepID=UPI00106AD531|nr:MULTISPECIES: DUF6578 domain-containing protein [unclassified Cryobacterium]TFB92270.1 hypothetical protein E3O39_17615 [Cryobacterium sp. MDB2-A-1]TFC02734.1 hypothetical protein E3O59_17430 [Cryobacterium sp. MDB2-33-2]TFC08125.1 hypothetical protein E3O35_17930 [Cryobacterium sp. MDB2-A-2]TFC16241.1 hypothetical protein E3O51_12730 [Cryobacterium sp. MDB2-10]
MTRVWLTKWEWACCGDAFAIGDEVDFGIETRTPHAALSDVLGPELIATVDAMESHHEGEFTDRVRGRVVAAHAVTQDVIERRSLRRPGHGAPPESIMSANANECPMVGRKFRNGAFLATSPSRYMIEIEPIASTTMLTSAEGVRLRIDEEAEQLPHAGEFAIPPPEQRRRSLEGWLVDVQEHA